MKSFQSLGPQLTARKRSVFTRHPPLYFWEFLRRHPAYLEHWKAGNRYWALAESERADPRHRVLKMSVDTLWCLGVSGPAYPDPALTGTQLRLGDFDGLQCARPVTARDVAGMLALMPAELRRKVGQILIVGGDGWDLLQATESLEDPDLDRELTGMICFNINASRRSILANCDKVVADQQRRHGIQSTRQRDDVFDEYLRVWDEREGWAGGAYDAHRGKRLRDIAKDTDAPLATVQSQYEAAFQHITGHAYDPDVWCALFGSLKLGMSKWAGWRRKKGPRRNDAPTVFASPMDDEQKDKGGAGELEYRKLRMDFDALVRRGRSAEEIVAELDLSLDPQYMQELRDFLERRRDGP